MAKVLKFWHTWSWAIHLTWMAIIFLTYVLDYKNSMANTMRDVSNIQQQLKEENMKERMAIQEHTTIEINNRLMGIELVQGKIFDRINAIADKRP